MLHLFFLSLADLLLLQPHDLLNIMSKKDRICNMTGISIKNPIDKSEPTITFNIILWKLVIIVSDACGSSETVCVATAYAKYWIKVISLKAMLVIFWVVIMFIVSIVDNVFKFNQEIINQRFNLLVNY